MLSRLLFALAVLIGFLWLNNNSLFVAKENSDGFRIIAHRGVHQTFSREGLTNTTCTAKQIFPPTHEFLENTNASMAAAFDFGAEIVELDVHLTSDGQFAVFHDWTVDCRTNGSGVTQELSMAYLSTLDIGFGYTADGGKNFPFRGKGIGLMPTLPGVLNAFPEERFLINFKSGRQEEGAALVRLLHEKPEWQSQVFGVYGGHAPTEEVLREMSSMRGYTMQSTKACLIDYGLWGWSGYVPPACRDTFVVVPINYARWLWGWPHRFEKRLAEWNSELILLGARESGDVGSRGIDDISELAAIPEGFGGYIWTNRVEVIGPALNSESSN